MGVFGFIENFFFISLGIAFALVLLLVYHFKNRMSVAEKKSETMYSLISSVVKEIKTMRSMFGLKPTPTTVDSSSNSVPLQSNTLSPKMDMNVVGEPELKREVIMLDLATPSSSENAKIVVSDNEYDDDDDDDDDESDSDSGLESDSDSEEEHESDDELSVEDLGYDVPTNKESSFVAESEIHVVEEVADLVETTEVVESSSEVAEPSSEVAEPSSEVAEPSSEVAEPSSEVVEPLTPVPPPPQEIYTIEQLRKMNINQLKTIAIQSGISVDTSKLKKHDLITLILE